MATVVEKASYRTVLLSNHHHGLIADGASDVVTWLDQIFGVTKPQPRSGVYARHLEIEQALVVYLVGLKHGAFDRSYYQTRVLVGLTLQPIRYRFELHI